MITLDVALLQAILQTLVIMVVIARLIAKGVQQLFNHFFGILGFGPALSEPRICSDFKDFADFWIVLDL